MVILEAFFLNGYARAGLTGEITDARCGWNPGYGTTNGDGDGDWFDGFAGDGSSPNYQNIESDANGNGYGVDADS